MASKKKFKAEELCIFYNRFTEIKSFKDFFTLKILKEEEQ